MIESRTAAAARIIAGCEAAEQGLELTEHQLRERAYRWFEAARMILADERRHTAAELARIVERFAEEL